MTALGHATVAGCRAPVRVRGRHSRMIGFLGAAGLVLMLASPARSQDAPPPERKPRRALLSLSDKDVFLPITSIEWGAPDRWSFTTRYVHMFGRRQEPKTLYHQATITLIPGTAGGRIGVGYQGIFSPRSMPDMGIFGEARAVLLRTWGNPLSTEAGRTFIGAEIRSSFTALLNLGVGWYREISASEDDPDSFWGFHVGVGI